MTLNNKTIVLTGASSGIGLELAQMLATANHVIGISRSAPKDTALRASPRFTHIATDFADRDSLSMAISTIRADNPDGIDGLINCAAVQFTPRLVDPVFDPDSIVSEIAINLTTPILLVARLLDLLQQGTSGFILNVNSGLGIVPKHESAVYCATKAALDNFSRGLRAQLSHTDIDVLQAFLPLVATPMTEGRGSGKLEAREVARRILEGVAHRIPDHDIGKVKLLRLINRLSPTLANRIMQKGDT